MTDDDLVVRLRAAASRDHLTIGDAWALLDEAADALEVAAGEHQATRQRLWAAESSLSVRWALAREIEAALGITTELTDEAALHAGVEAIRRLRAERDAAVARAGGV